MIFEPDIQGWTGVAEACGLDHATARLVGTSIVVFAYVGVCIVFGFSILLLLKVSASGSGEHQ